MTGNTESITVIVPVYIGSDLSSFRTSIRSLLNQSRQPDELVIVLDGPIKEICWTYIVESLVLNKLPFSVKLVCCLNNKGPGYARNLAASISSSIWLAIHDADDRYARNRLEVQLDFPDFARHF